MGEVMNGHEHLASVEEWYVAMWNVQNIGLFAIEGAVREFELFFVAVNAADKADVLGNVGVMFQFLGVAEGDCIADIFKPMLDACANTGLVDHAGVNCNFGGGFGVNFGGIAHIR